MLDLFRAKLLGIEPEKFKDFQTLIRGYQLPKGGHHSTIVGSPTSWSWGRATKAEIEGTAGKLWKFAGAGADPTEIDPPAVANAGDILIASHDAVVNPAVANTWEKMATIKLGMRNGTYRIKFTINRGGGYIMKGCVYRNDIAVGTVQTAEVNDADEEYSEDISGWLEADEVQFWTNSSVTGAYTSGKNFRVFAQSSETSKDITP